MREYRLRLRCLPPRADSRKVFPHCALLFSRRIDPILFSYRFPRCYLLRFKVWQGKKRGGPTRATEETESYLFQGYGLRERSCGRSLGRETAGEISFLIKHFKNPIRKSVVFLPLPRAPGYRHPFRAQRKPFSNCTVYNRQNLSRRYKQRHSLPTPDLPPAPVPFERTTGGLSDSCYFFQRDEAWRDTPEAQVYRPYRLRHAGRAGLPTATRPRATAAAQPTCYRNVN